MSLKQAFNYEIFYVSPEVTINTKNIYTSYTQKRKKFKKYQYQKINKTQNKIARGRQTTKLEDQQKITNGNNNLNVQIIQM